MIQRLRRFKTWLKPQVMRFLRLTQLYRLRSPAPAPTRPMWPVWQVEKPDVTKDFDGGSTFHISGWIAYPGKLEKLRIADSSLNAKMPVRTARRPEFRSKYGFPGVQFSAECPLSDVHGKPFLTLAYEADRRPFEIIVPVHTGKVDLQERKATKLARIEKILACPSCRTGLQRAGTSFSCAQCQANYPVKEEHIDFLTEEFKREFNIVPTSNVSANGYDGTAMNEIYRLHDKLILDCGAGFHSEYFENVVNYEIVAYDSTDVLGVGERLPFSDHSFDAVFSFAVLEHVKDPFLCARELMRVLKPGGYFYCEVPFLQPVHGYPHHYYNMTQQGLRQVFQDSIEITSSGTHDFGKPIFTLTWFLNAYAQGLPEPQRTDFLFTRVKDLIQPPASYFGSPLVRRLSEEAENTLSCCNYLIGTKR